MKISMMQKLMYLLMLAIVIVAVVLTCVYIPRYDTITSIIVAGLWLGVPLAFLGINGTLKAMRKVESDNE